MSSSPKKPNLILRSIAGFLYIVLLVFGLAWRFDYWQGWVFIILNGLVIILIVYLFSNKMDLIQERLHPGPGVKWWDKVFFAIYKPLALSVIVVGVLDSGRFGWTVNFSVWLYAWGILVYCIAIWIVYWAMWTNNFFSSQVRIQTDRGHYVVQNGPYRFVRHPGYVGAILLFLGLALVLGSYLALVPALIMIPLILTRTYLEDSTLHNELPGYAEYAQKVRYRLFPGIW